MKKVMILCGLLIFYASYSFASDCIVKKGKPQIGNNISIEDPNNVNFDKRKTRNDQLLGNNNNNKKQSTAVCYDNFVYTTICGLYVSYDHVCFASESAMVSQMWAFDWDVCYSQWVLEFGDMAYDLLHP